MTRERTSPAARFSASLHFRDLTRHYALTPSAVLIRTPEAELLSKMWVQPPILDLCCGDGYFASLIRDVGFDAGCDLDDPALHHAARRGLHKHLARANIVQGIPFRDGYFGTVVSNSSLEHVEGIDAALREISRVLRRDGRLHMTLGSDFAYKWWPCGHDALRSYKSFQPVHNAFSLEEWTCRMADAGLTVVDHSYYLSRRATRLLTFLDYHLSKAHMTQRPTLARPLVKMLRVAPRPFWTALWRILFARVGILQPEEGGGIWITAERGSPP